MKIGSLRVAAPLVLAALEEHSNFPLRMLMKQSGAALVCSERVDAAAAARRQRPALRRLYTTSAEAPRAAQFSGKDSAEMAEASRVAAELSFDLIDLNFECPIRRLVARGEGGALLADPASIAAIVAAVVGAVSVPVTIKIRSGPDGTCETAVEVSRRAADAGAAAVCVHARSVAQGYVGGPDWSVIARVKQAVAVPVIGSGGIRTATDAVALLRQTGADAVAIARGCLGNPWIFREARALLADTPVGPPALSARGRVLIQLVEGEFQLYGPPLAVRRLPRVAGYFAHWLPDADAFRRSLSGVRNLAQFRQLVKAAFR